MIRDRNAFLTGDLCKRYAERGRAITAALNCLTELSQRVSPQDALDAHLISTVAELARVSDPQKPEDNHVKTR